MSFTSSKENVLFVSAAVYSSTVVICDCKRRHKKTNMIFELIYDIISAALLVIMMKKKNGKTSDSIQRNKEQY